MPIFEFVCQECGSPFEEPAAHTQALHLLPAARAVFEGSDPLSTVGR